MSSPKTSPANLLERVRTFVSVLRFWMPGRDEGSHDIPEHVDVRDVEGGVEPENCVHVNSTTPLVLNSQEEVLHTDDVHVEVLEYQLELRVQEAVDEPGVPQHNCLLICVSYLNAEPLLDMFAKIWTMEVCEAVRAE